MSDPSPPYRGVDWDDALEQGPEALIALGRGQARVEWWIEDQAATVPLTLASIQAFHRMMFEDIWPDFAGRLRGPDAGHVATNVSFGNYRGTRFEDIPNACEELSHQIEALLRQLDAAYSRIGRKELKAEVARVAAYAHCELVRIHPFVNGNGRTSRACISYFMARYGFLAISYARPAVEYIDAIRTYLQRRAVDHFADYLQTLMESIIPEVDGE